MTSALNILLTTKTACTPARMAAVAGPLAMAGARTVSAAHVSSAGVNQDHNFNVLADRGAG
jgi:hypothetical protein